jgi:hypothetical protein
MRADDFAAMPPSVMTQHYKWFSFVLQPGKKDQKTKFYACYNTAGEYLGNIHWNTGWRQYCWYQEPEIIMAQGCLQDVCSFLGQLKEERRLAKEKVK